MDLPRFKEDKVPNLVPVKRVREIFSITDMTLWRWIEDNELNFPKPLYIKTQRYFREDELILFINNLKGERK